MKKKKFLACCGHVEFRRESTDGKIWICSAYYPDGRWDLWHTIGEQGAISSALATAMNTVTHRLDSPDLEWRDFSDLPDEQWDAGLKERGYSGYDLRKALEQRERHIPSGD